MKGYTKGYLLAMAIVNLVFSIGMLIGGIILFAMGFAHAKYFIDWLFIILSVVLIGCAVPFFISFFKFKKYSKAQGVELIQYKNSIIGWNIALMIIYAPTVLMLIFMIVSLVLIVKYISDIEKGEKYHEDGTPVYTFKERTYQFARGAREVATDIAVGTVRMAKDVSAERKEIYGEKSSLEKQKESLVEVKQMKEQGLISEEEYNALRKKILGI